MKHDHKKSILFFLSLHELLTVVFAFSINPLLWLLSIIATLSPFRFICYLTSILFEQLSENAHNVMIILK